MINNTQKIEIDIADLTDPEIKYIETYNHPNLSETEVKLAKSYSKKIFANKLAKGQAAHLCQAELEKQMITHVTTWKPTRIENLSKEKRLPVALNTAYKLILEDKLSNTRDNNKEA